MAAFAVLRLLGRAIPAFLIIFWAFNGGPDEVAWISAGLLVLVALGDVAGARPRASGTAFMPAFQGFFLALPFGLVFAHASLTAPSAIAFTAAAIDFLILAWIFPALDRGGEVDVDD